MTGWSPDLQWLIGLCRYDLGGRTPAFTDDVDGQAVAVLAEAHRVPVIAHRGWQALADRSLAPAPPTALAARATRDRRRSFLAAAHLVRLARAFAAEGVPWIALKGPALSVQLHRDPTVRTIRDLDVIVPPAHFAAAVTAAAAVGWIAPPRWRDLRRITARHDMELQPSLPGQPLLELHEALGPRFTQFRLDPFAETVRETVCVAGTPIPTLGGPALAAYVAWHGARGLWYRLAWLLDLARLLPSDAAEAQRLAATARACGAEIAVRAGAHLAGRLFDVPAPPWPAATAEVARRADRVGAWGLERLRIGIDGRGVHTRPGSYRWIWREVAQQDAVLRAALAALAELTRPTMEDAERLGLEHPLILHRLARPYFMTRHLLHDLTARR